MWKVKIHRLLGLIVVMGIFTYQYPGLSAAEVLGGMDENLRHSMERNIRIMENILAGLLGIDEGNSVQGIYIENYGLIFDISGFELYDTPTILEWQKTYNALKIKNKKNAFSVGIGLSPEEESELDKILRKRLDDIRSQVEEFFLDYASAIRNLKTRERICVNINFNSSFLTGLFYTSKSKPKTPSRMTVSASVEDLTRYRTGKMNSSDLKRKLKFKEVSREEENRDVRIMSHVLDALLEDYRSSLHVSFNGNTRGIYLKNFGVIFFTSGSLTTPKKSSFSFDIGGLFDDLKELEESINELKKEKPDSELQKEIFEKLNQAISEGKIIKEFAKPRAAPPKKSSGYSFTFTSDGNDSLILANLEKLKTEITEALGTYGHTLKDVPPDEFVLVVTQLNRDILSGGTAKLFIKVNKADIDRYAAEKISEDEFIQKASIWLEEE